MSGGRSKNLQLPKQLPLAELEHRLSSVPGDPTKGYVWRTLVAAFWRDDLMAANFTRDQLRELLNAEEPNRNASFEGLQTFARRDYSPEFRRNYLDQLLLNSAEAVHCVELGGQPSEGKAIRRRADPEDHAGRVRRDNTLLQELRAKWPDKTKRPPDREMARQLPGSEETNRKKIAKWRDEGKLG